MKLIGHYCRPIAYNKRKPIVYRHDVRVRMVHDENKNE